MSLTLDAALAGMPLIAILRGVKPDEVEAVAEAIVAAGIRIIEVPLNSPEPFDSIGRIARSLEGRALVGAGTVLNPADVGRVAAAGGTVIVSPNTNVEVIRASKASGLLSLPGFFTPSEAFAALEAGADALKLFPAEMASPAAVKGLRAVLPRGTKLLVVGGVSPQTIPPFLAAGVDGFGVGSDLYAVGRSAEEVGRRAEALAASVRAARG
ncbi:2-dehydro-3-deoxy-6-phosphogalactonate aldolase [Labrys monachus]|uniref:2-dehydro-3-deoxyphosphogalactonate aldolase n=1 Tax=Labrys monachus TaxID=217067 RepID=A0ABU0FPQ9_9HYPH|nr:2-dehydro-3-deoxy-6-phosphogalactonate aldolase [Labrys monachus]MDQ0396048.1 2-dehydro-3-deoxyphosphogalactonate aldolase [Labrys monachus]